MASILLLLFFFVGSSLASATPLLGCGFGDRQMSPSERIKTFLDCLRNQGHDEEILTELKKSFEGSQVATPSAGPLPPHCAPETASYGSGMFPYCSGMSDLQCRTLILVLDSLVNAPPRTSYAGGISVEKIFEDPVQVMAKDSSSSSSSSSFNDDEEGQAALMNIILSRFNDILEEYKRWRMENGGRQKRSTEDSAVQVHPPIDDKNKTKNATSGQKIDTLTPEEGAKATSSRRMRSVRVRRQADPGLPFKLTGKLTPEMQVLLESYLSWREKNGYGKMSGRWG